MILREIDYKNFTEEQLEEFVEFVNWYKVPLNLITDKIKQIFSSIPKIEEKIWLRELICFLQVKNDQVQFSDQSFLFDGEKCIMAFNSINGFLWCSHERIFSQIQSKYNLNIYDTQMFIRHNLEEYYNHKCIMPSTVPYQNINFIEQHFKWVN